MPIEQLFANEQQSRSVSGESVRGGGGGGGGGGVGGGVGGGGGEGGNNSVSDDESEETGWMLGRRAI